MLEPQRLNETPPNQAVKITTAGVTANQISLEYSTPNGNQPADNGNTVFLWQSGNEIPWQSADLASQPIGMNTPSGGLSFEGLDVTTLSYIVGYAVGPKANNESWPYGNVAASVFIPAMGESGESTGQPSFSAIDLSSYTTYSVTTQYTMLNGANPLMAGSYVGIWEGPSASYASPPMAVTPIQSSSSRGTASINNITLTRGTLYTVALFVTGFNYQLPLQSNQLRLACTHTFST